MTCEQCGEELTIWDRRAATGKVCATCRAAAGASIDWDAVLARVETTVQSAKPIARYFATCE